MRRLALLVLSPFVLALGCASTGPTPDDALRRAAATPRAAGIQAVSAECAELDSGIGRVRARIGNGLVGVFGLGNDQRRLEALEARSEHLGCGAPSELPSGWTEY